MFAASAIVRKISSKVSHGISSKRNAEEMDSEFINKHVAEKEHEDYVSILKTHVHHVIELESDERYPDCVFVEDPIVVVEAIVFLNRMGALSRRGEIDAFRELFFSRNTTKFSPQYTFVDMYEKSENATVDGGDCCAIYETKHLFMGISSRTNMEGVSLYENVLSQYGWKVIPVKVKQGLHLKSFVTYFLSSNGEILLSVNDDEIGRDIFSQIEEHSNDQFKYKAVFVPEEEACNVVSFKSSKTNKHVIIYKSGYQKSENIFKNAVNQSQASNVELIPIKYDELAKLDGCLTCCSVLFQ
ncbi:hypothetical protein C9374_002826 [Naegleria lovaniensis]|uniref:Dimethylargininase n=1 Tax=Naegleria lovaniensis TaxID=51637 RepID=A0AA88KK52_NAELO|nr:uncharacterized protein C9374_002826 [Naegleria lovaniensis]KAG2386380.1 hypothetical protein C9374_002826 [Naegleria lovaniensis]